MMRSFQEDFNWQLKFIDQIKQIVGPLLLDQAPLQIDQKEATDLLILTARDKRIACRTRRPGQGYLEKYPHDFTIRCHRATGAETEMRKISAGFGDWLFYGHSDDEEKRIVRYMIVDLAHFRFHLIEDGFRSESRKKLKLRPISNGDGTSFLPFDWRWFPDAPPILVAKSF
jgi:hypothetical protein